MRKVPAGAVQQRHRRAADTASAAGDQKPPTLETETLCHAVNLRMRWMRASPSVASRGEEPHVCAREDRRIDCPIIIWGRLGFDVGRETRGACRGAGNLVNPSANLIVANDDNYALAA
jgi:hypothetical protein